jgi:hypothetical protein
MSTEWAKQQEQLKGANALCAVSEERKKAISDQHNAALEEIRQARNKTKVRNPIQRELRVSSVGWVNNPCRGSLGMWASALSGEWWTRLVPTVISRRRM